MGDNCKYMAAAHLNRPGSIRVTIVGVLLSVVAALIWFRAGQMQWQQQLADEAAELESRLNARIEAHLALLRGTAGLLATQPQLTRDGFHRYVAELDVKKNYGGIQGIGWTVRVPAGERESFIAETRRTAWPQFSNWPDNPRDEYHAILYLEPGDERNRAAIGYDMHTDAVRRAAMDRARDSGRPAATRKVTLVQEIDEHKQGGFLLYLPFYRGPGVPATVDERRERLIGFVYAPFRTGDFINATAGARLAATAGIAVYDREEAGETALLYRNTGGADGGGAWRPVVSNTRAVKVVDQAWTLVVTRATGGWMRPLGLFAVGLAATAGLVILMRREHRALSRAERSEAETRLREGELRLLIESVPAMISYVDRHGIFRLCNSRYRDWFGLEPAALVGRRVADAFGPSWYAEIEPYIGRATAGETVTYERWVKVAGGARYIAVVYVPHRTPDGQLNGFYSVASDLSAYKRAEESARFVADCGKLLIASFDYETAVRGIVHLAVPRIADLAVLFRVEQGALHAVSVAHVDGAMAQNLSDFVMSTRIPLDAAHNIGKAARTGMVVIVPEVRPAMIEEALVDPAQREMVRALDLVSTMHVPVIVRGEIWAVFSFGDSAGSGRRFTDADRSLADEVSTRVRLAIENSLLFKEAQQEIDERRRAEQMARETEERFGLLVDAATDYAIILLDPDGRIASWNDGAKRILGFAEAEAVGLSVSRLFSPEDEAPSASAAELAKAREVGSAPDERWYVRKDGTRFWASGHTVVLRADDGSLRGYAKIMRDLTERKLSEEELEQRVQQRTMELNEAVQELEAFSYSVSHDLRSPLRSIRGFTELALEEAGPRLNETERGYLNRVQRAVRRLDQLISDLLAYTRVSKTRVELVPVDLHSLAMDLRREHPEFQPPDAQVRIEGQLLPVMGNVAYLTQCLTNLLGNAVKFVRSGQPPEVWIWSERRGANVRLYVRDAGIGIPAEHVHRVFEMFERLHVSAGYEGTGVGLAIVRRAVQRMKGTVGVTSTEGVGSTFWVELPAAE